MNFRNIYKDSNPKILLRILTSCLVFISGWSIQSISAQCDTRVSGVLTYCFSQDGVNQVNGYMVGFRVADKTGTTLDVVDLLGNNVTNRGKRINDIVAQNEPTFITTVPLVITGIGADSLEYWYFGPYLNGDSFNIALVDPSNTCDTIFVASGVYDCMDLTPVTDPGACAPSPPTANPVPLYFLDFSSTEFNVGSGGSDDEVFLIMQRSREDMCCDIPSSARCFEFIIRLAEDDIGLAISDVGSGSTGGTIYADSLNGFTCTGSLLTTWPFIQANGPNSSFPLCLPPVAARDFVVLTCKAGNNVTGASIDALSNINAPTQATIEPCNVSLEVFNADTVTWSSPDDPNLDNLISCTPDSTFCMFVYNQAMFGEVTACEGDTFSYIVGGVPMGNLCLSIDTVLYDTTYVIVYPVFSVNIDTMCNPTGDSLIMNAIITSPAIGCDYNFAWSTGDSTQTVVVPFDDIEYFVTVTRADLPMSSQICVLAVDSITAVTTLTVDCANFADTLYHCVAPPPPPDLDLVNISGCAVSPLVFSQDFSNGGIGCGTDTLIITRYYIVDFDGDLNTTTDQDTCTQLLKYVDDIAPLITCPPNITVQCNTSIATGVTGNATTTDNCDATPTIGFSDVSVAGTCPQESTITRTFTAIDDCGNSSTCTQTIFVDDSTSPQITCPPNITIQCNTSSAPAATGSATATDNCDVSVVPTFSDVTAAGTCPQELTITRTWTAIDDCGNSSSCTQSIFVDDSTAPVITCPPNVTIQCNASTAPATTGTASATDNCDGTPTIQNFDYFGTPPATSPEMRWVYLPPGTTSGSCTSGSNCQGGIICFGLEYTPGVTGTLTSYTTGFFLNCYNGNSPVISNTSCVMNNNSTEIADCGNSGLILMNSSGNTGDLFINQNVPVILHQVCLQLGAGGSVLFDEDENTDITTSVSIPGDGSATEAPAYTNFTADFDFYCNPPVCPYPYTIYRQFVAMDDCGNESTCVQQISIQDNTPPVITCPPNITIQCNTSSAPAVTGTATATDNCDASVIPTFTDVTIGGLCPQELTITRTWMATDDCGNSSSCAQIIFIDDSTPPVITCPPNITVQCNTSTATGVTGDATATDNCDGTPTIGFDDVTIAGACPQERTITRTFTAIDDCGNSSMCTQTIFVDDSTPPNITCPQNITIQCNTSSAPAATGSATATDICDASVIPTFSDVTTGGTCPQELTITRTWTATDDCGNSTSCVQTIFVDDSTPPGLTCPQNITVQCSTSTAPAATGTAIATDNCDASVTATFSDVTVGGTCPQELTITRTWSASDDCGNSSSCVQTIFVDDSTPPQITCPPSVTVQCGSSTAPAATGSATVTDNCDASVIPTFTDVTVGGICPQELTVTRTWMATDDCGNSSSCVQTIFVDDATPPVITCPQNITVQCNTSTATAVTGNATATDNCDGSPTIGFDDVTVGGICPQEMTITRTFTAIDDCGNSSSCFQTIFVDDATPPVLTCPQNITIQCNTSTATAVTGNATATDNCDASPTIGFADVTAGGICPQNMTITRTFTAIDDCGNSSSCTQLITIQDTNSPSITCPVNTTILCTASTLPANTGTATATDACDATPTITSSDVTVAGSCPQEYTITRTWNAADDCGNSATCVQIILVDDNAGPSITCPANVTILCTASTLPANTGTATATDNCDGTPTITSSDVTVAGNCPQEYTINRTWNAADDCGNSSSCVQVIFVDDNEGPVLTCPPNITVLCTASTLPANTGTATATDNCDVTPTITSSDVTVAGGCPQEYTINRTWSAADDCGNSTSCVQVIFVDDNAAPSITCPPNVTVLCTASTLPANTGTATATDNCDVTPTITSSDVTVAGGCPQEFTINRTWNAADDCGNSSSCVQVIFVDDNAAPGITCPANITVLCTVSTLPANTGTATATDNCDVTPTITSSDVTVAGGCPQEYTITRTWNAADGCGNSSSCVQTIFVDDNAPPSITCPAPLSVSCANQVPAANTNSVTASDNCGTVTITLVGDVTTNQTCANRYTLTRTYRASDACGNSATCNQVITVNDQTPPTITCPQNITINFGSNTLPANTGNPTSADNCSGVPTVTFSDVTIAGECSNEYTINRTWTATDACGMTATCLQTIGVVGGCVVDLALEKTLDGGQGSISGGDNVNFTITVSNEGELAISSVSIIDYIPIGFSLNDPDWTAGTAGSTGQSASITLSISNGGLGALGLIPGASVSVGITLQADPNIPPGVYNNIAEILQVIDINGMDVTNNDIDSQPDDIDTNDPPGEDDQDLAEICVLPQPVIVGDNYVCPSELVTYTVAYPNPNNTYVWSLSGGGNIVQTNGPTIQVQWFNTPGGPFQISVQEIGSPTCQNTAFLNVFIQGFEPIACNDNIQISLGPDGIGIIDFTMILEGENEDNNNYYVVITDQFGNILPEPIVNCSHVGQTLIVSVRNLCNNQSCWGTITVEDKLPPQISCTCPINNTDTTCEITCLEVNQLLNGEIPPQLQPTVTDNCSAIVTIANIDLQDEGCGGGYIRVTWLATDPSGNTASCTQQFNIVPLTLETLVCPPNYVGECNSSTDPDVTGWPTVLGYPLTDEGGLCNIFAGYWDHLLADCGGGQKILRTWTILDWCTVELIECEQIIKLTDNEGPVLECPNDLTIGTDFWYCYANFSVPKPQAEDACSEIENYQLWSSAGTVVSFGSNFVVNNLPIGTHILRWTVSDECGNSSSCSFNVTVEDHVVPVANCDAHTIVSLSNDGPGGITLVPAQVFDDGSYDNCGPVTFRARRMDSCIDIDWTTEGACIDDIPGGIPPVNSRDRGTVHRPCVPFACCDVGAGPIMVELEVTDEAGNKNFCMIEVTVQDKISAYIECPPDIIVSCDFWFPAEEGTYIDADGNNNGNLDEDPLSRLFGNMYDAFRYDESARQHIVLDDQGNEQYFQPHDWGLDGWADDNCEVNLSVRVRVVNDCSGEQLPGNAPPGAVKMIERRFVAEGAVGNSAPATCTQRIWVVDFDPFYISDNTCNNNDPNDGVIWPCDVTLTTCPDDISGTGEPIIFDDACNLIGVTYEDTRFDFVEGACFKILRDWAVIDWCQYNPLSGYGLWHYTQIIKVHDHDGPEFQDCPPGPVTLCVADPGVTLPDNNQAFLGEENPLSSSCSVHLNLSKTVFETCSGTVQYDVKLYPFNGSEYIQLIGTTSATVDSNHQAVLTFDTHSTPINDVRLNGIPYNSKYCGDYHRILWSVQDGCGNWSHCEYLLRLEDCKQPTPVCINGLSTVVMPIGGQVTIWAKDFDASSFDDCTTSEDLLFSFSGDSYQPSFTYTCDNVPAFGVELSTQIWVADGGTDDNCNGLIEWSERNKDYCTTTIVITDNNGVCAEEGSVLAGEILNEQEKPVVKVNVSLNSVGHYFPIFTTIADGKFKFNHLEAGLDYSIFPERNDEPRNGVSTLDLVKIQKHLLGIEPFTSPYQYIASDANNNKAVSAIDLVEIRKLILGIYQAYPDNKSWRFVEKGFPMTTDHPWPFNESIFVPGLGLDSIMGNDFVAVKIGDVNNSAKANFQQVNPRNGRPVITAIADACEVNAGETCLMIVTLPEVLSGFQWTFETQGLEFVNVSSNDINMGDENVGILNNGIVTMSWNGDVRTDRHEITFTITWKALTSGSFDKMMMMSDLVTPAEAYSADGEVMDVRLAFRGIDEEDDFALYQNKPNPWDGFTSIGFVLPQDADAVLTIYDVAGKEIYRTSGSYSAGYNSIVISQKELPNAGVMYYKLESGGYSASKKMVLIR